MREFCFVFVGRFAFQHGAVALFVYLGFLSSVCQASDLGSTKITAVRSTVEHFDGTAKGAGDVGQSVTPGHSVSTKEQSLAELTADDKSIIRLGANSVFSYSSAERIVKLDKGTMLMHTPPGNGGATIDSGGVVGAISGTTFMLTASPAKCSECGQELRVNDAGKVICRDHPTIPPSSGGFALIVLEGSSVTKVTGPDGQMVAVAPGQMAVVGPKGSGAPVVYAVNLTQIARTSPLINAFPTLLPSMPQIISTAYQLQNQNLRSTGTSGVAISSSGQLLTAASPPPNPFLQTFTIASNQPGQNNSSNPGNLANISTAAGGGGGGGPSTPTGVATTGGGPSTGPTIPSTPSTPPNQVQNAVAANQPTPVVPVTVSGASVVSRVYNGTAAASIVGALLSGAVSSGVALANETTGTYADKNVGTWSVATSMGLIGTDAANYSLTQPSLSGTITAKDITMSSSTVSKKYDGTTTASVTLGTLSGLVGSEQLLVSIAGSTGAGTFSSKDVGGSGTVSVTYQLADDLVSGGLVSNYNLTNPTESLTGAITKKDLQIGSMSVGASKVYDGTRGVVLLTGASFGTTATTGAATTLDGLAYTFDDVQVDAGGVGTYNSKDVAMATRVDFSGVTLKGNEAGNYNAVQQAFQGATITKKDLSVVGTTVTAKAYDGTTAATLTGAGFQVASAPGAGTTLDGKPYTGDTITLGNATSGIFVRSLPGTLIPVAAATMTLGGAEAGNYNLVQPTGLKGEITGSATLNQNGAALNVNSAEFLHVRNTTATRMQDGMQFTTTAGGVLIENSSFDGWMKRTQDLTGQKDYSGNQIFKIEDGGATTFQFTESAAVAVNSPVLRIKMEANDPTAAPSAGGANLDYMLLGDYQLHLRHDVDGDPLTTGDIKATTVFSFPGNATDTVSSLGSIAPGADLVIRDSASTQMKDLPWNTQLFSSLDVNGEAVPSGSYATAAGEYKPDGLAAMSDLNIATSAGKWDVTVSDPALGGEGKVTDLRLKYNNSTKALIEGPDGVRLVNVKFEGMDEVEVGAGLNDKVLMSGTLVSDPNIGKMVVKAGQTLEAHFASDATMKEVRTSAGNAEILAGVVKDASSPTGYSFISGPNRMLEMQTATIAGQLSLASHTIVFNNANITSGGVIDARTRDGMVNRTYGSVVPGTVSFMGANGNTFLNTANSASMSIANSGNIVSALSGGQMRENGVGGATVMNVGRVR